MTDTKTPLLDLEFQRIDVLESSGRCGVCANKKPCGCEKIMITRNPEMTEEQFDKMLAQSWDTAQEAKIRRDEREKVLEEVLHQLELTVIFGDQAQQEGIIEPDWVGRLNKFIHYYRDQLNQLKEEG